MKEKQKIKVDQAKNKKIKPLVFWPPFLILVSAVVFSLVNYDAFSVAMNNANDWLLGNFSGLFSIGALLMLILSIFIIFSPFGRVKIGGSQAKPMLSKFEWFSITICTTIAIGILFWAAAEPMYHMMEPPTSLGIAPNSAQSANFAMSTMFLHWTFTPYAIYSIPSLMFAFAYYNMKEDFSLSSLLTPLFGNRLKGKTSSIIDAVALYALVGGMAASLGTGILTVSGGINNVFAIPSNHLLWAVVALAIIGTFIISASTGLMKGIRILSSLNVKVFLVLIVFTFIVGPTGFFINFSIESFGHYLRNFFQSSLFTGAAAGDDWSKWWTTFYWANWLAWAPVTALFLGRIAYGYTVRMFMFVNFVLPSLFGSIWMSIFSGTAIHQQLNGLNLAGALGGTGPEAVSFAMFSNLPLSGIVIPFYIFIAFISFVTAADSNTSAMAGISSTGISPDSPAPPLHIKLIWGLTIGVVAWGMITFAGIDGIKMLSNLGGFPALFLISLVGISLTLVAFNPKKYDSFKSDYDQAGRPLDKSKIIEKNN